LVYYKLNYKVGSITQAPTTSIHPKISQAWLIFVFYRLDGWS